MGKGFQDLMLSKIPIDISACKENFLMFISKIYCNLTKLTLKKKKFILVEKNQGKQKVLEGMFFEFRKDKQKHFEAFCSLYMTSSSLVENVESF